MFHLSDLRSLSEFNLRAAESFCASAPNAGEQGRRR